MGKFQTIQRTFDVVQLELQPLKIAKIIAITKPEQILVSCPVISKISESDAAFMISVGFGWSQHKHTR